MIVACNSCPSQYSVPDAKVRGKKVRITCKHCAASIIVDGTNMAAEAAPPSPLPKFRPPAPLEMPGADGLRQDDVTLIARPKFGQGVSVHDEPTVIGQIPREALEYERAFSQRTQPPPAGASPAPAAEAVPRSESVRPSALPEVPESVHDETKRASPRAFALPEPPTAPLLSLAALPVAPPPVATVIIKQIPDEPTLVSGAPQQRVADAHGIAGQRPRLARFALMLLALALVSFVILKLR